jgi:hypothetical protein
MPIIPDSAVKRKLPSWGAGQLDPHYWKIATAAAKL